MLDWLKANVSSKKLQQNSFFKLDSCVLFIPSLQALHFLPRSESVTHTDSLYTIDQVIFGDRTLAYIVNYTCPTVMVYANLVILHARKTVDLLTKHKVYVQNTLPHFDVINNVANTTSMLARNVTTAPRT